MQALADACIERLEIEFAKPNTCECVLSDKNLEMLHFVLSYMMGEVLIRFGPEYRTFRIENEIFSYIGLDFPIHHDLINDCRQILIGNDYYLIDRSHGPIYAIMKILTCAIKN